MTTRLRLGVVLLLPEPVASEVNGLRRACGDPALASIAPHITLVPPVNVRRADVAAALQVLRAGAAATEGRLTLTIGPAATFGPESPTLFLDVAIQVDGDGGWPALQHLRDAVSEPPLRRRIDHAFHPHVTLAVEMARDRLDHAVAVLADYRTMVEINRVTVLEQQRDADGHRRWMTLADAALGRPDIVERGGLRLEVSDSCVADPDVAGWLPIGGTGHRSAPFDGDRSRYVTARHSGHVLGVLVMDGLDRGRPLVSHVVVAEPHRRFGVGRLLVERAVTVARAAGATELTARSGAGADDWLVALGWVKRDDDGQVVTFHRRL